MPLPGLVWIPSYPYTPLLPVALTPQPTLELPNPFPVPPSTGPLPAVPGLPLSPYRAKAVHFDGNTILTLANFLCATTTDYLTFSVWCKSGWAGRQTVFELDVGGDGSPFIQTAPPLTFVMQVAEAYSGTTPISSASVYYSTDAVNWTKATTPVDSFSTLCVGGSGADNGQGAAGSVNAYFNGLFLLTFGYDAGGANSPNLVNAIIYSYDGVHWQIGWTPSPAQVTAGTWYMNVTNSNIFATPGPWVANGFQLSNAQYTTPPNVVTPFISCINPSRSAPPPYTWEGDNMTPLQIIIDPAQDGGNLTLSSFISYANNSLPTGVTAVRFRESADGSTLFFDYTSQPITQAMVNSGNDMPGAPWINSFNLASSGGTVLYGFPTGASPGSTGLMKCDYSGIGIQQDVTQSPLVPPNFIGWVHIMGTIRTDANIALLYINDEPAGTFYSNEFVVSPKGKTLYIGGDTFGSNYVGDMAELYLYPNVSLITNGIIPVDARRVFIDAYGAPTDPAFGALSRLRSNTLPQPSVFMSGDSSNSGFLQNTFGSTPASARILIGELTDASSSPSDIYR